MRWYKCGLWVCYGQIRKRLWSSIDIVHRYATLYYTTIRYFIRTVGMAVDQTLACAIYYIYRRIRHNSFVVCMNAIGVCLNENTIACYFYRCYHIAGCLWNCICLSCITQLFTHRVPKIATDRANAHIHSYTDCFLSTIDVSDCIEFSVFFCVLFFFCWFNQTKNTTRFQNNFKRISLFFLLSTWIRSIFPSYSMLYGIILFFFPIYGHHLLVIAPTTSFYTRIRTRNNLRFNFYISLSGIVFVGVAGMVITTMIHNHMFFPLFSHTHSISALLKCKRVFSSVPIFIYIKLHTFYSYLSCDVSPIGYADTESIVLFICQWKMILCLRFFIRFILFGIFVIRSQQTYDISF